MMMMMMTMIMINSYVILLPMCTAVECCVLNLFITLQSVTVHSPVVTV